MGVCSKRRFLLAVCCTQVVTTSIRQTFDFLGYMWTPVLTNFFNIIFSIFGFFGAYQYRPPYVISYCIWSLFWMGWNVFVICFYLEFGVLNKDGDALNLGTGSASWWETNGFGCRASYPANLTGEDVFKPLRPEKVTGCLLQYETVEAVQASVQILLAVSGGQLVERVSVLTRLSELQVLGGLTGIWVVKAMFEEDDSSLPASKSRAASLYSIELNPERPRSSTPDRLSVRGAGSLPRHRRPLEAPPHLPPPPHLLPHQQLQGPAEEDDDEEDEEGVPGTQRAKPMTPRRVKRRSTSRGSTRSRQGAGGSQHINPVSRLLEQQERRLVGHCNPTYQSSSQQSLDRPASSYSNYHGQRPVSLRAAAQVPTASSSSSQLPPLPITSLRHSYRRHMHQAPPPYNGHYSSASLRDSETVI